MEYITPAYEFDTFPQWHTLAPSGPAIDNWTDDDGDPIREYEVQLLYPPNNFWFLIRIDLGAIEIDSFFHCYFLRDLANKKVTIQLDWTLEAVIQRVIKFTFPFDVPPFLTHKMCSAGLSGDYSLRNYQWSPSWQETIERTGAPQPTYYWFLHLGGAYGYVRPPWGVQSPLLNSVFTPISKLGFV